MAFIRRHQVLAFSLLVIGFSVPASALDFADIVHAFTADYFKFEPMAALDLGITGQEPKHFGHRALRRGSYAEGWPRLDPTGLAERRDQFAAWATELGRIREEVRALSDEEKVDYNMMVARTNLINLWHFDRLEYQLPIYCPSLLTAGIKASQMAVDTKGPLLARKIHELQGLKNEETPDLLV